MVSEGVMGKTLECSEDGPTCKVNYFQVEPQTSFSTPCFPSIGISIGIIGIYIIGVAELHYYHWFSGFRKQHDRHDIVDISSDFTFEQFDFAEEMLRKR